MLPYKLYGAAISLYTGKVRAYLRYRNVAFVEEPGSREVFDRIGFRMIPVLHTSDDELVQDSTAIIDHLEVRLGEPSVYPTGARQRLIALLFEVYGDEWLVIPAMHYRWAHNLDYILEEFGKTVAPDADPQEQRAIGEKISAPFRGLVPSLGIDENTIEGIEADYEALLLRLNYHFESHRYLFGSRPSIGDFGLMGPLYAHNYRDPYSGDLMRRIAPNVVRWIDLMNTPAPNSGSFLPNDEVPQTLLPMLEVMFAECMPTLLASVEANAAWLEANPTVAEMPRNVGEHEFTIGGKRGKRMIRSFSQWMLQRPLAYYQSLAGDERVGVDNLLRQVGGYDCMQKEILKPLTRRDHKLVAE